MEIKKKIKENRGLITTTVIGVVVAIIIGGAIGKLLNTALSLIGIKIPEVWTIGTGITIVAIGALKLLRPLIKRVPYSEYWIVDRRGTPIVKTPGYRLIIPFFGYDKIVQKVMTKRQYHIPLFPDMKEIWIDLFKGGEIRLHDPRIWIVVKDPLKAVKTAANFEEQLREMVENRLTGTLNVLTYEDIVELRVPKVLTEEEKKATKIKIRKKIDEIIQESEAILDFLKKIHAEYRGFTLDDFDFDSETTAKRRERITTDMEKQIAKNRGEARKNEISIAIAKTAQELQKVGFSAKKAQEIASERYQDHLVGEKGRLQKIVWQGEGLNIPAIATQWELGRRMLETLGKRGEKSKESKAPPTLEEIEKKIKGVFDETYRTKT